jgi:hypothetical protein
VTVNEDQSYICMGPSQRVLDHVCIYIQVQTQFNVIYSMNFIQTKGFYGPLSSCTNLHWFFVFGIFVDERTGIFFS